MSSIVVLNNLPFRAHLLAVCGNVMHPPEMQDPLVDSGLLMNWFTDSISMY